MLVDKAQYLNHLKILHMKTSDKCPICQKIFALNHSFKVHVVNCIPFKSIIDSHSNCPSSKRNIDIDSIFENSKTESIAQSIPDMDFDAEAQNELITEDSIRGIYSLYLFNHFNVTWWQGQKLLRVQPEKNMIGSIFTSCLLTN